ncbi:MAG: flagellar basal-body MS-ring/collar protein FliF [Proteobacteria bacterium]|nr:flagellar basal-body MS-ring/collar protein FliF [Pseudomonadota bacterium]
MLQVLGQAKDLWGKQPKGRRLLAILVVLGILGVVGWTTFIAKGESWVELAAGASPDDVHDLHTRLEAANIPARMTGTKLEVPADRADEARALAASAGLPHGGKGFELFDGSSLGESSFTEQVKYRRALQGELARSIASLAQVESARVHLALGKRSVFKDHEEPPSASVALHLHAGQQLTSEQVRGVRQLVAASIEGLRAEQVVVVDNHGNLLEAGETTAADRQATIEHNVASRVRSMLERVVGAGKVSVVATAEVDESKVSETEEFFDKDKQAIRSESRTVEGPAAAAGGTTGLTGTPGNLQGAAVAAAGAQKLTEAKNYEVSRTVRQTTKPDSKLQKLRLAVVVDYKTVDGKPVPRDDKEIAELVAIATQAAGLDATRGDKLELRALPFAPDAEAVLDAAAAVPPPAGLPITTIAAAGGGLFVVLVLVAMMRGRARRRRAPRNLAYQLKAPMNARDFERALDAPSADEPLGLPAGRPVQDRVLDVVRGDVERAAEVLTAWLQEPAPKGAK